MALTGNKGEWSEIYTLFKLLGEGKVHAGDENMDRIKDIFYPIIMILRQEKDGCYNYVTHDKNIIIQTSEGQTLLTISVEDFLREAESLLCEIKLHNSTFAISKTETFMHKVHCSTLKAKSSDKTDIRIVLHDYRTKINTEMGFSIKSQLGGNSTLLNPGKTTNFKYKIVNANLTDNDIEYINRINSKSKILDKVNAIIEKGASLVFEKVDNDTFHDNLLMLDCHLPDIMAHLLVEKQLTRINSIKELTYRISEANSLKYKPERAKSFYEFKIKQLLVAIALGMMPATPWNGKYDANGGYLVVKNDGDIVCYHFFERNRIEDFLFCNTYLEGSSTTRYEYASIVKENDGTLSFKLNLQIRLK